MKEFDNLFEETRWYEENGQIRDLEYRTAFHLMPPVGWMNDPNGLCQMNGRYHVFFQYTPAAADGNGYRGWGHYSSENLTDWRYEGMALAPDSPYDKDGAYSGSAFIENGKMYLYYTGNVKEPGEHDYITEGRGANVLLVESPDGCLMGAKKLLLTNSDYPSDYSCHVRDPKVFQEDGTYYMVLGGRTLDGRGKVLLYHSTDKYHWSLLNQITSAEPFGYMWECPDLFRMGDTTFLSVSPQGVKEETYRYQNVYQSGWFTLSGDYRKECTPEGFTEWDMGFDFYAPQTFADESGRRILYGWAGIPDAEYTNDTLERKWQHCLTVPRELSIQNGKLCQYPVKELEALRTKEKKLPCGCTAVTGRAFELVMTARDEGRELEEFKITVAEGMVFRYDGKGRLILEFTSDIGAGRKVRRALIPEVRHIRMLVDASVAEIYINGGEMVFTTRLYPRKHTLTVDAENTLNILWELSADGE